LDALGPLHQPESGAAAPPHVAVRDAASSRARQVEAERAVTRARNLGGVAVTQDRSIVDRHVALFRRPAAPAVFGEVAKAILRATAALYRGIGTSGWSSGGARGPAPALLEPGSADSVAG